MTGSMTDKRDHRDKAIMFLSDRVLTTRDWQTERGVFIACYKEKYKLIDWSSTPSTTTNIIMPTYIESSNSEHESDQDDIFDGSS